MPSTDAPTWWADVQQERDDLAGPGRRPADDWLGEDIDFIPRRRMARAATPPPPAGTRRTVQIKGRPSESRMPSRAQRHRGRTASDRIGARPDRIALWAVALGAILILLAAMTSSSQAAVTHRATAPAVSAHVAVHHAPAPAPLHR
jgi:hypothetical protein